MIRIVILFVLAWGMFTLSLSADWFPLSLLLSLLGLVFTVRACDRWARRRER